MLEVLSLSRQLIWRALMVLAVLAIAGVLVATMPARSGLDLHGGTQIVLAVFTASPVAVALEGLSGAEASSSRQESRHPQQLKRETAPAMARESKVSTSTSKKGSHPARPRPGSSKRRRQRR